MITQISKNRYNFKIRNVLYKLEIRSKYHSYINSVKYEIVCINRVYLSSFYKALGIYNLGVGNIVNKYLQAEIYSKWSCYPAFRTYSEAVGFLYYLDKNYNPTPGSYKSNKFINFNYLINPWI